MATIERDRTYTPEDLRQLPDFERYELVSGQLLETGMGALACGDVTRYAPPPSDVPLS